MSKKIEQHNLYYKNTNIYLERHSKKVRNTVTVIVIGKHILPISDK